VVTVLVVWTKAVVVSAQWTPSERLWNVPAVLTGRVGLLSNSSGDPSSWTSEPCKRADAGAANGLVTGTLGRGRARREQLSLVAREPEDSTPDPTVTVVICARSEDRWDDLLAVVTSVKQQTHRPAEIVLVIDHNPKLQRRSTFELPGLKVIPNDNEKGLAGARNAGAAAATSEIVAFLDDETVAAHNWLAALVAAYADPHVLGVGGQVVPAWPTERPGWFPPEFDWVVGCSYRGMPAERTLVRHLMGAIMSLRRRLLVESGGFDVGLSRIGTRPLGCEEIEICIRTERRHPGGVYLYEPRATVRRHVPRSHTTWSYYRSRCYSEGLSKAVVRGLVGLEWRMSSEKPYLRSIIPRAIGRNLGKALRGEPIGIAGAAALTVGVIMTGIGYVVGRIRLPRNPRFTPVRWRTMAELGAVGS
jgi:glycosyltransferase involved in cell wall biosynthesis